MGALFLLWWAGGLAWADRVLPPGPPAVSAWVEANDCSAGDSDAAWLAESFRQPPPADVHAHYFHSTIRQAALRPAGRLLHGSHKGMKALAGRPGFRDALRGCMQMAGLRQCGPYRYFQQCMADFMVVFGGDDVVEGLADLAGMMHLRSLADTLVRRCQQRFRADPVACLDASHARNQLHTLVWSHLGRWIEEGAPPESVTERLRRWENSESIGSLVESALASPSPSAGVASP